MRLAAFIATFALTCHGAAALEATCTAQSIRKVAQSNTLVISEAAITSSFQNCPTTQDDLGTSFSAIPHRPVYLWFRIEGTKTALSEIKQNDRFRLRIIRAGDILESSSPLQIANPYIDVTAMKKEVDLYDGYFDWRFHARVETFYVPGDYSMQITFGGRPICFLGGHCKLSFHVAP